MGVRFSPLLPGREAMSVEIIEVEGFQVEVAAEIYCARGGDHRQLVDRARADRSRLGHDVDESAVLCIRCLRAIPLTL